METIGIISGQLDSIESTTVATSDFLKLSSTVTDVQNDMYDLATASNNNTTDISMLKSSVGNVVLNTINKSCTGAIVELNNKIGTATLNTQATTITNAINELAAAHDANAVMHGMVPTVEDSTAEDLETLKNEYNVLLALLRARGVIG